MEQHTITYLREVFQGEPPWVVNELTGEYGLWWRDLMDQLAYGSEEVFLSIMSTLHRDHNVLAWLWYTEDDLVFIAQAKCEARAAQN
jgi:hypothetical protein